MNIFYLYLNAIIDTLLMSSFVPISNGYLAKIILHNNTIYNRYLSILIIFIFHLIGLFINYFIGYGIRSICVKIFTNFKNKIEETSNKIYKKKKYVFLIFSIMGILNYFYITALAVFLGFSKFNRKISFAIFSITSISWIVKTILNVAVW